ncbi:MAG: hypothetical protein AVDCRST_MAG87-2039, partial [uncultured Thermomicrobiales bacterium]
ERRWVHAVVPPRLRAAHAGGDRVSVQCGCPPGRFRAGQLLQLLHDPEQPDRGRRLSLPRPAFPIGHALVCADGPASGRGGRVHGDNVHRLRAVSFRIRGCVADQRTVGQHRAPQDLSAGGHRRLADRPSRCPNSVPECVDLGRLSPALPGLFVDQGPGRRLVSLSLSRSRPGRRLPRCHCDQRRDRGRLRGDHLADRDLRPAPPGSVRGCV